MGGRKKGGRGRKEREREERRKKKLTYEICYVHKLKKNPPDEINTISNVLTIID